MEAHHNIDNFDKVAAKKLIEIALYHWSLELGKLMQYMTCREQFLVYLKLEIL